MKKTALVVLALALLSTGVAYAVNNYLQVNSNGGFPISSEGSTKKAALRCWVMKEGNGNNYWSCPSGELCQHFGTGTVPTQTWWSVTDCIDLASPPSSPGFRQCQLRKNGSAPINSFTYKLGVNHVAYHSPTTLDIANCAIPQNLLQVF